MMKCKCIIVAAAILVLLTVSPVSAGLLVNGDFESVSEGNFTGWTLMPSTTSSAPLVESSSVISGSYSGEVEPGKIAWQSGLDYATECTYSMDFAYFIPATWMEVYGYLAFYNSTVNSGSSVCEAGVTWRVNSDNCLYLLDGNDQIKISEVTVNPTTDSGDDGLWDGETPVVNHLELTTHFSEATPYYDLTVNGVTVTGLNYANQNAGLSSSLADVDAVAFRLQGSSVQPSNWLVDNVTMTPVSESIPGDANSDGKVDGSDVTILAGNWQVGVGGVGGATWEMGDFNGDGAVDGSDVTILAGNWQAGVTAAAASVPEPSTLALLFMAIGSFLIRRRRS